MFTDKGIVACARRRWRGGDSGSLGRPVQFTARRGGGAAIKRGGASSQCAASREAPSRCSSQFRLSCDAQRGFLPLAPVRAELAPQWRPQAAALASKARSAARNSYFCKTQQLPQKSQDALSNHSKTPTNTLSRSQRHPIAPSSNEQQNRLVSYMPLGLSSQRDKK